MHTAARDGNEYTMKGLAKLGADINIKDKDGVSDTLIITAGRFSYLFQAPKEVLVLFPGLPQLRFLIMCGMQKWREKAW